MCLRLIAVILAIAISTLGLSYALAESNLVNGEKGFVSSEVYSGEGGLPVSATTVSLWLIKSHSEVEKELAFVVFLRGREGWYDQPSKNKTYTIGDAVVMDWKVGEIPIKISYFPRKQKVQLFQKEFDLADSNVFLVDQVDSMQE